MNTVALIVPGSITAVAGVKDRPVFFLCLQNQRDPSVTVKGDSPLGGSETSIQWGSKMMKNVNNAQVNTKIMTPQEILEFKAAARRLMPANDPRLQRLDGNFTWVKMPFVRGLTDAGFLPDLFVKGADNTTAVKDLKELAGKFAQKQVWFDLGKVVAVDMFNANYDRFDALGNWQNKGNVMFHTLNGQIRVIGLDTYDPTSEHRNLTLNTQFPELNLLRNTDLEFAKKVTLSVTKSILKAMLMVGMQKMTVKGSPDPILIEIREGVNAFLPYAAEFQRGMTAGARELKAYLQGKVAQYRPAPPPSRPGMRPGIVIGGNRGPQIPEGVLARMRYLSWLT